MSATTADHAAAQDFRVLMDTIDQTVPKGLGVHVVLDNAATHKMPLIHRWLAQRPLQRGAFRSTHALEIAIRRYIETSNAAPKPFVWSKTADDILDSVKRFCQRTSNSHHLASSL